MIKDANHMFFNLGCRPTTTRLHFDFLSCWVWSWSREKYEGYLFFRLKDYTSNQWEILIVCWSNCTFIFFCFSKNGKVDLLFTENFNLSLLKIIACLFSFLSYKIKNRLDITTSWVRDRLYPYQPYPIWWK